MRDAAGGQEGGGGRPLRVCLYNYAAWYAIADGAAGAAGAANAASAHGAEGQGAIGGEEIQHVLLSRHLAGLGVDVTSLVGDFGQCLPRRIGGVNVCATFAPGAGLPGLRGLRGLRGLARCAAIWRALRRADADVYYVSCAGAIAGIMAAFCRRHGRRFVFRVASDADCAPHSVMLGNARDRWLYHYGLHRADAILVQTARQAALLARHHGLRSTLAGMFAPLPRAVPGAAARAIDLLWLANLRAVKRPDCFLALAAALPERRCAMAGGPHHAEPDLYAGVARAAAALPNLRFHGALRPAAAAALFADARVFVNTSTLEGFPNTYLQAWASATPVVATFDPDGLIARCGLGVAVADMAAARRAILALLDDPAAWAACSARCRAYAEARLAPDTVAAPYLAALAPRSLGAGGKAAPARPHAGGGA